MTSEPCYVSGHVHEAELNRAAKIERVRAAWGKTPGKTYLTYEQMAAAAVDALEGM